MVVLFAMLAGNTKSQNDTTNKNHFGVSIGVAVNLTPNFDYYPVWYTQKSDYTHYPELLNSYGDLLYKNALHSFLLNPNIQLSFYMKNGYINTLSFGYIYNKLEGGQGDYAWHSIKNFYLNYEFIVNVMNKPTNWLVEPFVGLDIYYSYKYLTEYDEYFNFNGNQPNDVSYDYDNSNLFLIQLPVGIKKAFGKISFCLQTHFNLMGFINGKNNYLNNWENVKLNYSKTLLIDKLYQENYILQNVQIKIGYIFK